MRVRTCQACVTRVKKKGVICITKLRQLHHRTRLHGESTLTHAQDNSKNTTWHALVWAWQNEIPHKLPRSVLPLLWMHKLVFYLESFDFFLAADFLLNSFGEVIRRKARNVSRAPNWVYGIFGKTYSVAQVQYPLYNWGPDFLTIDDAKCLHPDVEYTIILGPIPRNQLWSNKQNVNKRRSIPMTSMSPRACSSPTSLRVLNSPWCRDET